MQLLWWATDIPEVMRGLALVVVPGVLRLGAAGSEVSLVPYLIGVYLEGDPRMNCWRSTSCLMVILNFVLTRN